MGEFFSGPGGLALGAHKAAEESDIARELELRHAWAVDLDADSCRTYYNNLNCYGATRDSVKANDVRVYLEQSELDGLDSIDGFAFGFPCNDFSIIGEHKGLGGKYGGLYRTGVEVLERKKPKWFVAENVGGIRSANNGAAFRTILHDLVGSGYVITPHLYRFEQYGVPQSRHRVIIVGIHEDLAANGIEFRVPVETHGTEKEAETLGLEPHELKPYETAGKALGKLIPDGTKHCELSRISDRVRDRLDLIEVGQNAFNASDLPPELRLNVRGATFSQIYRKLDPDRPSYTVTGSGGGGTHMYHWAESRALTNRERARLQTFPDSFEFSGNRTSIRRQIGMAVPVEGARVIFRALFKSLLGIPYRSREANLLDHVPVPEPTMV